MAAVSHKCFSHFSPVFALSLVLRANRSDNTQALGAGRRSKPGERERDDKDGSVLNCNASSHGFSPCCPIGSLLIWAQHHIKAPVPHLRGNYKDGMETGCENYCGCWQLVLITCACLSAPIPTCRGDFFFLTSSCEKKGKLLKATFPCTNTEVSDFFSSGSYYVLDAEFLLCNFITCMLSLLRGSQKEAVSSAVLKFVSDCFLSSRRDVI